MQKLILAGLISGCVISSSRATETIPYLRIGVDSYTNVVVTSVSDTDLYFTHSQGMGNVRLKRLSPELQKRFGYQGEKAAAAEQKQAEANQAYQKEVAAQKNVPRKSAPSNAAKASGQSGVVPADIPVSKISAASFRGQPAPQLTVRKWLTPAPDTNGKFILIDFWATWCGPCRQSIPHLNQLHAKFKDQLVVIGLSDESEQAVRKMKAPQIAYSVGIDPSKTMSNIMQVRGIPHAIIIGPDGIVRFEGHPNYLTEKNLAGLLAKYSNP